MTHAHGCCDHCECTIPRSLKEISHRDRKKLPPLFAPRVPIALCVVPKHTLYSSLLFYDADSQKLIPEMKVEIGKSGTMISTTAYWCFMKEALPVKWLMEYDVVPDSFLDSLKDTNAAKFGIAEMLILKLRIKLLEMVPRVKCVELDSSEYHVLAQRIWEMDIGNSVIQLFEFKASVSCSFSETGYTDQPAY